MRASGSQLFRYLDETCASVSRSESGSVLTLKHLHHNGPFGTHAGVGRRLAAPAGFHDP